MTKADLQKEIEDAILDELARHSSMALLREFVRNVPHDGHVYAEGTLHLPTIAAAVLKRLAEVARRPMKLQPKET